MADGHDLERLRAEAAAIGLGKLDDAQLKELADAASLSAGLFSQEPCFLLLHNREGQEDSRSINQLSCPPERRADNFGKNMAR